MGIKFTNSNDHKKLFAAAALGLTPHLGLMAYHGGLSAAFTHAAMLGGMTLIVSTPYVREIPLFLTRVLFMPFMARKRTEPSERLKTIFNEVAAAAGMKSLKLYQYDKGSTDNAFAFSSGVYIGKGLVDKLNDSEIKGIIAHEISHHKTRDASYAYILGIPMVNAAISAFLEFSNLFGSAITGTGNVRAALASTAIGYCYFKYQQAVSSWGSRTMEYRADRNAVQLTSDPDAMVDALTKITYPGIVLEEPEEIPEEEPVEENADDPKPRLKLADFFLSHPKYDDRVDAIYNDYDAAHPTGPMPQPSAP